MSRYDKVGWAVFGVAAGSMYLVWRFWIEGKNIPSAGWAAALAGPAVAHVLQMNQLTVWVLFHCVAGLTLVLRDRVAWQRLRGHVRLGVPGRRHGREDAAMPPGSPQSENRERMVEFLGGYLIGGAGVIAWVLALALGGWREPRWFGVHHVLFGVMMAAIMNGKRKEDA